MDKELLDFMQQILSKIDSLETKLESTTSDASARFERLETRLDHITTDVSAKFERIGADISGIKVVIDTDICRDMKLLAEGHETILERLPEPEDAEAMDARVSALEAVVKKLNRDIQNLKKAQ